MRRAIAAIVARDLKRMLRQRGRLVSSMVRPLIWLFVIGTGFQGMLESLGRGAYQRFLVPGLMSMVVLFGALLASLSMIYDKESRVMRMLIIAPLPRAVVLLARTLGAALIGICQALLLMAILFALGYLGVPRDPALCALGLVAQALVCASLGTLIAVFSKALEDFAVITNFVIFPVFFLSGALYPIEHLPGVLKAVALANPFSYGRRSPTPVAPRSTACARTWEPWGSHPPFDGRGSRDRGACFDTMSTGLDIRKMLEAENR